MRILWVNPNFLHPTNKGGQIRTLEMLKRLHRRHEIHYAALENPSEPEGLARSGEYSSRAYPFRREIVSKSSPRFLLQLAAGLWDPLPVAVRRFYCQPLAEWVAESLASGTFDRAVCDFLAPAPNFPSLGRVVLFQHNVESVIWRRRFEQASDPARRFYLKRQYQRMIAYEGQACRSAGRVVAVSELDAQWMKEFYGVAEVSTIPTGVDLEFFAPRPEPPAADLVFVGSMDWMPNVDGARFFIREVLPLIRRQRPDCTLALVGRTPGKEIRALAEGDRDILVTGTVADARPWLWGAKVSIVPLRIGGGTRLKIYEAMAARVPVVSTRIGAEGLPLEPGKHLLIADEARHFAAGCLELLASRDRREALAQQAWEHVAANFSWERVTARFEEILAGAPAPRG